MRAMVTSWDPLSSVPTQACLRGPGARTLSKLFLLMRSVEITLQDPPAVEEAKKKRAQAAGDDGGMEPAPASLARKPRGMRLPGMESAYGSAGPGYVSSGDDSDDVSDGDGGRDGVGAAPNGTAADPNAGLRRGWFPGDPVRITVSLSNPDKREKLRLVKVVPAPADNGSDGASVLQRVLRVCTRVASCGCCRRKQAASAGGATTPLAAPRVAYQQIRSWSMHKTKAIFVHERRLDPGLYEAQFMTSAEAVYTRIRFQVRPVRVQVPRRVMWRQSVPVQFKCSPTHSSSDYFVLYRADRPADESSFPTILYRGKRAVVSDAATSPPATTDRDAVADAGAGAAAVLRQF